MRGQIDHITQIQPVLTVVLRRVLKSHQLLQISGDYLNILAVSQRRAIGAGSLFRTDAGGLLFQKKAKLFI